MESRIANIIIQTPGGTASKGSSTYKVSLPSSWVKELGITEENRQIELSFDGTCTDRWDPGQALSHYLQSADQDHAEAIWKATVYPKVHPRQALWTASAAATLLFYTRSSPHCWSRVRNNPDKAEISVSLFPVLCAGDRHGSSFRASSSFNRSILSRFDLG